MLGNITCEHWWADCWARCWSGIYNMLSSVLFYQFYIIAYTFSYRSACYYGSVIHLFQTIHYCIALLRVFNFANFANFQPFVKIFQRKFLTCCVQCIHAANSWNYFNEIFKNRYSWKFRPLKILRYTVVLCPYSMHPPLGSYQWDGESTKLKCHALIHRYIP